MLAIKINTEETVEVKSTTKLFKGSDSQLEAKEYAKNKNSYVMRVYEYKTKDGKRKETFYGYGVPK